MNREAIIDPKNLVYEKPKLMNDSNMQLEYLLLDVQFSLTSI